MCECAAAPVWRSEDLCQESVLHHLGPGDWTLAASLDNQRLYLSVPSSSSHTKINDPNPGPCHSLTPTDQFPPPLPRNNNPFLLVSISWSCHWYPKFCVWPFNCIVHVSLIPRARRVLISWSTPYIPRSLFTVPFIFPHLTDTALYIFNNI